MKRTWLPWLLLVVVFTSAQFWSNLWKRDLDGSVVPAGVIAKLKAPGGISDYGPRPLLTIGADQHNCEKFPLTILKPLSGQYSVPMTVYLERDDFTCTGGTALTDADIATLYAGGLIEVGVHGWGWSDELAGHISMGSHYGTGTMEVAGASSAALGTGTNWQSGYTSYALYAPLLRNSPYVVASVTDARTLAINPNSPSGGPYTGVPYMLIEGFAPSGGVSCSGTSTPVITCSGCNWNTGSPLKFVQEPVPGGSGKGSLVLINSAPNNPYFISSIDSASQITLTANVGASVAGVSAIITPWFDQFIDSVTLAKNKIETAIGCSGCVTSYATPNDQGNPLMPQLLESIGINSMAQGYGIGWNIFGAGNPKWVSRITIDARMGPQGWRNLMQATSETDGWLELNLETVGNAEYKVGTATKTASSATIDPGGGADWCNDAALSACRSTPTNCWIFFNDDTEALSYHISTFDCPTGTITIDPTESPNYGSIPSTTITNGNYFIANLFNLKGSTGCTAGAIGTCLGTVRENLEEGLKWLSTHRFAVQPVTHAMGAEIYSRTMGRLLDVNLIANPKFRITRAEALPPRNLSGLNGTANNTGGYPGWIPFFSSAPDANVTMSNDATGNLIYTQTVARVGDLRMRQRLVAIDPMTDYTLGVYLDPSGVTDMTSGIMRALVRPGNKLNVVNGSGTLVESVVPLNTNAYSAGSPAAYLFSPVRNHNPGILSATIACSSGTCSEATSVMDSFPLQASSPTNASPDPYVVTRNSVGNYSIVYQPRGAGQASQIAPVVWVQSQTSAAYCTTGAPTTTTVAVLCFVNNVAADADFRLYGYDPMLETTNDEWIYEVQNSFIGTAKWRSPTLYPSVAPRRVYP